LPKIEIPKVNLKIPIPEIIQQTPPQKQKPPVKSVEAPKPSFSIPKIQIPKVSAPIPQAPISTEAQAKRQEAEAKRQAAVYAAEEKKAAAAATADAIHQQAV